MSDPYTPPSQEAPIKPRTRDALFFPMYLHPTAVPLRNKTQLGLSLTTAFTTQLLIDHIMDPKSFHFHSPG